MRVDGLGNVKVTVYNGYEVDNTHEMMTTCTAPILLVVQHGPPIIVLRRMYSDHLSVTLQL